MKLDYINKLVQTKYKIPKYKHKEIKEQTIEELYNLHNIPLEKSGKEIAEEHYQKDKLNNMINKENTKPKRVEKIKKIT